jgi:hypothetical protein
MALNLAALQKKKNEISPILLMYGTAGMGKTSLALEAPDPVYIQISPERPPMGVETNGWGEITSWPQVCEALQALYEEEHSYKTVVIDSLDALEPLIWKDICLQNQWANIETPGYGKGYMVADGHWRQLIDMCDYLRRDRNMNVIWLALALAKDHEEPGSVPYKRYDLKLHRRAEGLATQAADGVLFINTKVVIKEADGGFGKKSIHAEGGGTRWMFTDARPAFVAKNRFNMPETIMLPKGKAWPEVAKYLNPVSPSTAKQKEA